LYKKGFIRLFSGSLPFSCSSFDMKWFRIPLLCKERGGEVESVGINKPSLDQPLKAPQRLPPFAPP
jgi:hypothetical protein